METKSIDPKYSEVIGKVDANLATASKLTDEIASVLVGLACSGTAFRPEGLRHPMSPIPWYGIPEQIGNAVKA